MGRRAKPDEVKQAAGNPGRRPRRKAVPEATSVGRAAPRGLTGDARKAWEAVAPELIRLNFLRQSDVPAFSRYCVYFAEWHRLTKAIKTSGVTYETESKHGNMLRLHPNFAARDRLETRLEALEDRFGLTPAMRQRMLMVLSAIPGHVPQDGELPLEDQPSQPSPVGLLQQASDVRH